jgi:AcrR family transcriptional regulator
MAVATNGARSAAEDSRDRIIDTATVLIASHGLAGMSLQMLADQVGLHKSTLFHHFRGKAEVADEALCRVLEPLAQMVERLDTGGAPEIGQLVELSHALADHFVSDRHAALFLLRCMIGRDAFDRPGQPQEEDLQHPFWRIFLALGGWLDRARRAGVIRRVRVRQAVINLLGMVLLYPAIADDFGREVIAADPLSDRAQRARKEELAATVRGAFAPLG